MILTTFHRSWSIVASNFGLGGDQLDSAEALGASRYARMQGTLIDLDR